MLEKLTVENSMIMKDWGWAPEKWEVRFDSVGSSLTSILAIQESITSKNEVRFDETRTRAKICRAHSRSQGAHITPFWRMIEGVFYPLEKVIHVRNRLTSSRTVTVQSGLWNLCLKELSLHKTRHATEINTNKIDYSLHIHTIGINYNKRYTSLCLSLSLSF